ncbi:hypothetical protein [Streptomyces deccanensis]|uniref:hypothetical protein n=1 Tax=Streptomyces deccanensis TaxID=424188 RepID=UPI001EFAD4E5|nr:hypothetical protein [Streptomyces deccanensis]ULR56362.1 hypothetical protein L3078_03550 [Streptomyces deccanensis]
MGFCIAAEVGSDVDESGPQVRLPVTGKDGAQQVLTPAGRRALNGHLTELEEALANPDHLAPVRHHLEEQRNVNTPMLQDILGDRSGRTSLSALTGAA